MKWLCFLCSMALLLSGCTGQTASPEPPPVDTVTEPEPVYTHGIYEITLSSSLLQNDSVGSDWEKVYTCDGEIISDTHRLTVPLDTTQTVTIHVTVTERDDWSDVGTTAFSVELTDGFETSANVIVVENKGRYKGNRALWEITCNVKLVEKTVQQ